MFLNYNGFFEKDGELFLRVKVSPGSSMDKIGKIYNDENNNLVLKIYVTAQAEDGKANLAVINLLSSKLKLAKQQLTIVSGLTNRNKIIRFSVDLDKKTKLLKISL